MMTSCVKYDIKLFCWGSQGDFRIVLILVMTNDTLKKLLISTPITLACLTLSTYCSYILDHQDGTNLRLVRVGRERTVLRGYNPNTLQIMEYNKGRSTLKPRTSLPLYPKTFYNTQQIRFRNLQHSSMPKRLKTQVFFHSNPWFDIKKDQIERIVQRLQDPPEKIYSYVERRLEVKKKFRLLKQDQPNDKENSKARILKEIKQKKKFYEQQFRNILHQRKSTTFNILLPRLQCVKYVYGDNLYNLGQINSGNQDKNDQIMEVVL